MKKEKISVCMATFNGEKYIQAQMESILVQLSSQDELIVSDDGSFDNTIDIIKNFKDERIVLVKNSKKKSTKTYEVVSSNFENALNYATGDIVFLADQDDIWKNNKIEKCKEALQDCDLVLHDCEVVDENLNTIYPSYFKFNQSRKGIIKNLVKNSYLGCCMAFKKEVLTYGLPFGDLGVPHDIWIGINAERNGKVKFIDEPLLLYRRHIENISFSGGKNNNSIGYKIKYRAKIFVEFFKHNYL